MQGARSLPRPFVAVVVAVVVVVHESKVMVAVTLATNKARVLPCRRGAGHV